MRTREECCDLIGRRVVTPKGDGVAVGVEEAEVGSVHAAPFNVCVMLDGYASKGEPYDGTWMTEDQVTLAAKVGIARRDVMDRPLDFSMTFPITLGELADIAFVAGHLFDPSGVLQGRNALSTNLSEIVKRIVAKHGGAS